METLPRVTATAMEYRLCHALSDEFSCRHDHKPVSAYILGTMADQTATVYSPSFLPCVLRPSTWNVAFCIHILRQTFGQNIIVRASLPAWYAGQILRSYKRPLTHQHRSFAVRHRLSWNSLASPYGPFMVELFTAVGFADGPRTDHVRTGTSPCSMLPTPARLNAPDYSGPNPLDRITRRQID